jgi:hypothetical protein
MDPQAGSLTNWSCPKWLCGGPPIGGLKKAHVRLRREGTGGKFFRQYLEQSDSSSVAESFPVSYLCAHRETREQVSPKPLPSAISAQGVRQLGFWGATT